MSYARLSVAPDRRGDAFVAGGFRESLLLRSGERLVARGPSDGMLIRYSADGEPLWARAVGGEGDDWLVDASTDSRGNLYLAGVVQGAVDLDSDGRPDANVGASRGLLVASWDPEGKLRWAKVSRSEREVMAGGGARSRSRHREKSTSRRTIWAPTSISTATGAWTCRHLAKGVRPCSPASIPKAGC